MVSFPWSRAQFDGSARRGARGERPARSQRPGPPAWSSDGGRIAYTSGGLLAPRNLFIVEVADGSVRQVTRFTRSQEGPNSAAWLTDNRHLIVSYPRINARSRRGRSWRYRTRRADRSRGSRPTWPRGSTARVSPPTGAAWWSPPTARDAKVWKAPFGPDALESGRAAVRLVDATLDPMWTFVTRDGYTLLFNNALVGSRNLWTLPLDGSSKPLG